MPSEKSPGLALDITSPSRNCAESPICRLPVELLVSVFAFRMDSAIHDTPHEQSWMWLYQLRLVCRHWDSVVVRTPRLWTHIILPCNVSLLRLAFGRSKSLPLDIVIHTCGESAISPDIWAAIVHELRRLRSLALWPGRLAIEAPGSSAPDAGTTLMPTSWDAPLLSQLVLRDISSPYLHSLLNNITSATVLTSLTVTMHPRVWHEVSRFGSLKKLSIWPMQPVEGYAAPVAAARAALAKLSSLECLEAFCCFVNDLVQENLANRLRVSMPKLKFVVLTGSAFDSGTLLRQMNIRYDTVVNVTDVFGAHRRLPEAALQLTHTVPALFNPKVVPIAFVGLQCVPNAGGESWRDQLRICCCTLLHGTRPQVSVKVQDSALTAQSLLANLPVPRVHGLSLGNVGHGRAHGFDVFLHAFKSIRELVLWDTELTWVYMALLKHNGLFPQLRTLKLARYSFLSWCLLDAARGGVADAEDENQDESAEAHAAQIRAHASCTDILQGVVEVLETLETLLLIDCDVAEEVWPAIVKMAPDVRRTTKAEFAMTRQGVLELPSM